MANKKTVSGIVLSALAGIGTLVVVNTQTGEVFDYEPAFDMAACKERAAETANGDREKRLLAIKACRLERASDGPVDCAATKEQMIANVVAGDAAFKSDDQTQVKAMQDANAILHAAYEAKCL